MGLERVGACSGDPKGNILLNSVEAVFEKVETVAVAAHFDAFKLLDCDANTKALHGECFGQWHASLVEKVTWVDSNRCPKLLRTG